MELKSATYIDAYTVALKFDNGEERLFDFSPVISQYPAFKPLQDLSFFKTYTLTDTMEWADGEIDIAPEYLYEHGTPLPCPDPLMAAEPQPPYGRQ